MLIKDIEPITDVGVNLLESDNFEQIIEKIVELPLQKACKIFTKKGIQTVMSSANKNNVLNVGDSPVKKDDIAIKSRQFGEELPSFEYAGKGYAWIMLNFDTLSDENKDWLFDIEEKREDAVWFVHPCEFQDIEFCLRVGQFDYDFLSQVMPEDEIPSGIQVDQRLARFNKRHTVLGYNWRNISKTNGSFANAY